MPDLKETIGRIVGLGPCLKMNIDNHFITERDIASADAVQNFINSLGIVYALGPNHEELVAPLCAQVPALCDAYFLPNPRENDPYLYEESLKYYQHIHQNTLNSVFQEFAFASFP